MYLLADGLPVNTDYLTYDQIRNLAPGSIIESKSKLWLVTDLVADALVHCIDLTTFESHALPLDREVGVWDLTIGLLPDVSTQSH